MKKYLLVAIMLAFCSTSFANKIGVLKSSKISDCQKEIFIVLDAEDSDNHTKFVSGTPENLPGITVGGRVTFNYCVLDVSSMPKVPYDYAVLRLDDSCPSGSYPFARRHDTEDNRNINTYAGKIYPNEVGDNVTLEYCFVPADSKSTRSYPFDKRYGIYAAKNSYLTHFEIHIDDEDSNNHDDWYWRNSKAKDYKSRIKNIMNGSDNTNMHVGY